MQNQSIINDHFCFGVRLDFRVFTIDTPFHLHDIHVRSHRSEFQKAIGLDPLVSNLNLMPRMSELIVVWLDLDKQTLNRAHTNTQNIG